MRAVSPVEVGRGLISSTIRLRLSWADGRATPASVILKLAADDASSRSAATRYRNYEIESGFYRELAPTLDVRVPACHWAGHDPTSGDYAVILEDVAGEPGDQLAGCTVDEAAAAVAELALLHSAHWGGTTLDRWPWLHRHGSDDPAAFAAYARNVLPELLRRAEGRLSAEAVAVTERFAAGAQGYDRKGRCGPPTLAHGDFRADNLVFGFRRACVLDWQNVYGGSGLVDLGYFLGGSLSVRDRRVAERDLVGEYHHRMRAAGVTLSWDDCWLGYRRHAFAALAMVIRACTSVREDPRGQDLFMIMAERSAHHALDLESETLLQT